MSVVAGPGVFKFITVIFYAMLFVAIIAGVIAGVSEWRKTGDKSKLVDATLGQVVNWDGQIDVAMEQLKNEDVINSLPLAIRNDYRAAIAKQVLVYVVIFIIVGFLLYKLGNWLAGKGQFEPTTDMIIVVCIIGFFALTEFSYGMIMDKPNIIPFKGIINWLGNLDIWWDAIAGVINTNTHSIITSAVDNASTTVNL